MRSASGLFRRRVAPTIGALSLLGSALTIAVISSQSGNAGANAPTVAPASAGLPASSQFDITGFLQSATLDSGCYTAQKGLKDAQGNPAEAHCGGTMQINGITITVPAETIAVLPASALTFEELFENAPAPYGLAAANPDGGTGETGLALNDSPKPATTYEVQVVGNRVEDTGGANGCTNGPAGCDRYIAALVHVSEQDLNNGSGYISFVNLAAGEIEVGGQTGIQGTGNRIRINDPLVDTNNDGLVNAADTGRYGRPNPAGVDERFQVDQDNPTIVAETGFPMCLPRSAADVECPQSNRPVVANTANNGGVNPQPNPLTVGDFYRVFRMDSPANVDTNAGCTFTPCADPRKQAPFEVGDYVNYAGNIVNDGVGRTGYYVEAHTVVASLGIYTQPGIDPAYVTVEVGLIGTGGLTVFGAGEAAARTRFEGMATDETRMIRIYGVDIDPITGATSDREWGTTLPDLGPPLGAVRGRWRFRPPCTATIATLQPGKGCTPPPTGQFLPVTREVRAVVGESLAGQAPVTPSLSQFLPGTLNANPASQVPVGPAAPCVYVAGVAQSHPCTTANGIFYGQYHAPIGEFIFPENVPGTAVPENNVNSIPFLAYGGYTSVTGVMAGRLSPWPSSNIPAAVTCAAPTIGAQPLSVTAGASLQLHGVLAANATTPLTLSWSAGTTPGATDLNGALTGAATTTPTFNSTGLATGTYNLTFTTSGVCGVETAAATITVVAGAAPPAIQPIAAQTITAGNNVTLSATSTSLPLPTITWAQVGAAPVAITPFPATTSVVTATSSTGTVTLTLTTPGLYTFSATATSGALSTSVTTTVNVTAATPTNVTLSPVEYRTSKQRLVITATTTDVANVKTMKLLPYLTETGQTFDPATLGANLSVALGGAAGTFTITLVGAPPPACNLGGVYATPCSKKPITVKSYSDLAGTVLIGTSAPTALDRIRQ